MVSRGWMVVMKPVFLIGYRGCGKTTLGEALALQMEMRFIDLDVFIEEQQGMTIVEIFDKMGEEHFRKLELTALRDVAAMADVIVSCGGGTPCHGNNMALMNAAGTTVWLITSPKRITARLLLPEQKCKRPKINTIPDDEVLPLVEKELQARIPYYRQCQLQFDSTDIETAEATARTARLLAARLESLRQATKS